MTDETEIPVAPELAGGFVPPREGGVYHVVDERGGLVPETPTLPPEQPLFAAQED